MANATVSQILKAAGYSKSQRQKMTIREALPILGVDPSIMSQLRTAGFSKETTLQDFFKRLYNTNHYDYTLDQIGQTIQNQGAGLSEPSATEPDVPPSPATSIPAPPPDNGGPNNPSAPPPRVYSDGRPMPPPGSPMEKDARVLADGTVIGRNDPRFFGPDTTTPVQATSVDVAPSALEGDPNNQNQPAGTSGNSGALSGLFPQVPGITLPQGLEPQPFQMPAAPVLPTMGDSGVDLAGLMSQIKGTFDAQQDQRQSLIDRLNAGIAEQQTNAQNNQPMLDAAMANIQSVLTGQAMSPGLEGLINSAFSPAEAEGQRRLRQAAEEAASARGMSLTDSPIGNPYLEENRRFLEQMGGQRAQMGAQLREQDAAFSQNIRAFQEGLKQQALSNQTEVLRSLGTPEQAASVLGQLGLGAKNAAVQQYATQMQGSLGAADQGLRAALGQASTNQGNTQLALASQGQNFQQQLAKQQAAIQNQLAMFGALGDPSSAYGSFSGTGSNLSSLPLTNALSLIGSLSGNPVGFNPAGQSGGGGGNTLGQLGSLGMGLGSLISAGSSSGLWAGLAGLV